MTDKSWISHAEWVVMLITILGGFLTINSRMDHQIERLDMRIMCMEERFDQRLISQEARSDRLYEMFIDLLKERNHERR